MSGYKFIKKLLNRRGILHYGTVLIAKIFAINLPKKFAITIPEFHCFKAKSVIHFTKIYC